MRPHRVAVAVAVAFLGMHLAITWLIPANPLFSNLLLFFMSLVVAVACWNNGQRHYGLARRKWQLLALGLGFWCIGQVIYTYVERSHRADSSSAIPSDFYFFLWGVPILLAIGSADDDGDSAIFLVLDSIQAILAVFLTYFELFAPDTLSFTRGGQPMASTPLLYMYMAENLVLAGAATLRLLARPSRDDQHFYRVLCLFLWVYTAVALPANYMDAFFHGTSGTVVDVFWDLPFLVLFLTAFTSKAGRSKPRKQRESAVQTPAALIIYNACPALFTIAVLILAAHVSHQRFLLGPIAMALALFTYTLRAALIQTRYMRAQRALLESEKALKEANERLHGISLSDPLTGIANRRHFEQVLETEWNRAMRNGAMLSLLMIDVDHFKQINDSLGHLRGDECLVMVARSLAQNLRRSGELLARYGGEEFVAILPNVDEDSALLLAEEIRISVHQLCFWTDPAAQQRRQLTVSIGVCSVLPCSEYTADSLVAAADAAMYRAKERGRNRTESLKHAEILANMIPVLT